MLESMLKECLAVGKTFKSAQDFYNYRCRGHSYFVVNATDSQEEVAATRAKLEAIDLEEVARLQTEYADKWAA